MSITQPEEGQEIARSTFTTEPGLSVTFMGRFRMGEGLLLLVFSDASPFTPVFVAEARVEEEDAPGSARIRLAPETVDSASELEILLRVLEGATDRVISTDSVGVVLR